MWYATCVRMYSSSTYADHTIALFQLYEHLPFSSIVSLITVFLIITFFVTSSDSGSLVIDSLASGGSIHTPVGQRVFWASAEGIVASTLLLAGGLSALQTMSIISALPFALIMIASAVGLWRALIIESHRHDSLRVGVQSRFTGVAGPELWRQRLKTLISFPRREDVETFINTTVRDAMSWVEGELRRENWRTSVTDDPAMPRICLEVQRQGDVNFIYEIRLVEHELPGYAYPEMRREESDDLHYCRAEVFLRRGGQSYDIYGFNKHEIATDILDHFEKYLHFVHVSPGHLPWEMDEHDDMLAPPEQD